MEQARLVEELRAHLPALVTTLPVIAVYLVGSRSDGSDRPSSDVDLAVLAGPLGDPLALQTEIAARLEPLLGLAVDVIVLDLERLGLPLLASVMSTPVLLHSTDEPARVAFEAGSLTRTLDFELFAAPLRQSALVATAQRRR